MTDKDFTNLLEFVIIDRGALLPVNEEAHNLVEQGGIGEQVVFKNITPRDLKLHKTYFLFIGECWEHLPSNFQQIFSKDKFYQFLKHRAGKYEILYSFKDGSNFIEYESISFGRMNNTKFKEYVKEQIPIIYELMDELGVGLSIAQIENKFNKWFNKLMI